MPKVSVVIPTYNRANLLPGAINSVLSQDYGDFELIVIDDGSTDNTEEITHGYSDERLRYIKLPRNSGCSSKPRNVGIMSARGKYIAFLDSDDEWLPAFLRVLVAKLERSCEFVGVVYCGIIIVPLNRGKPYTRHYHKRGWIWPKSLTSAICTMSSSLIRRECFDRVGMFDEANIYQDHWDMVIRLSKVYEFDYVEDALAKYNYHAGQRTRVLQSRRLEALQEKYADDFARNPVQAGVARLTLGFICAREGDKRRALGYIIPNLKYAWRLFCDYVGEHELSVWGRFLFLLSVLSSMLFKRRAI